jgi:hypothetical protein
MLSLTTKSIAALHRSKKGAAVIVTAVILTAVIVTAVIATLTAFIWSGVQPVGAATISQEMGDSLIEFVEVAYDTPEVGQSTWIYRVVSGDSPAVSHVSLGMCVTGQILDAGVWDPDSCGCLPGEGDPEPCDFPAPPETDPTTGVTGIKFDCCFADGEERYYYFVLDDNYPLGDVDAAIQAGGSTWVTQIEGAICGTTSLSLECVVVGPCTREWSLPILAGIVLFSLISLVGIARRQPHL